MVTINNTHSIAKEEPTFGWLPQGARLVYRLSLQRETLSNNVLRGLHFHAYRHIRREWRVLTLASLGRTPREEPLQQAFLEAHRYCAGAGLDWDNAYGGLKPLLDCLVSPSPRNPDGLGLVVDDSPVHMPLPPLVRQFKAKPGQGRTELFVFDLSSTPFSL